MYPLNFFSEMASLGMALTLVRGPGLVSHLAPMLSLILLFSDLHEVETDLLEIEPDLP